jgi:hypothetical protein
MSQCGNSNGLHIGKVINGFNEYFKEHGDNEAREKYSFLSEFCGRGTQQNTQTVVFGR